MRLRLVYERGGLSVEDAETGERVEGVVAVAFRANTLACEAEATFTLREEFDADAEFTGTVEGAPPPDRDEPEPELAPSTARKPPESVCL